MSFDTGGENASNRSNALRSFLSSVLAFSGAERYDDASNRRRRTPFSVLIDFSFSRVPRIYGDGHGEGG